MKVRLSWLIVLVLVVLGIVVKSAFAEMPATPLVFRFFNGDFKLEVVRHGPYRVDRTEVGSGESLQRQLTQWQAGRVIAISA